MTTKTKPKPPMFARSNSHHVLKPFDAPITREKLEKILALIGWGVRPNGSHHWLIENNHGFGTDFSFIENGEAGTGASDLSFSLLTNGELFGKNGHGMMSMRLKECEIAIHMAKAIFIYARASKKDGDAISFYFQNYDGDD